SRYSFSFRAIFKLISFSSCPSAPTFPGSRPPCPGSMATKKSFSPNVPTAASLAGSNLPARQERRAVIISKQIPIKVCHTVFLTPRPPDFFVSLHYMRRGLHHSNPIPEYYSFLPHPSQYIPGTDIEGADSQIPPTWRSPEILWPAPQSLRPGLHSRRRLGPRKPRSEEHTSELQSRFDLV